MTILYLYPFNTATVGAKSNPCRDNSRTLAIHRIIHKRALDTRNYTESPPTSQQGLDSHGSTTDTATEQPESLHGIHGNKRYFKISLHGRPNENMLSFNIYKSTITLPLMFFSETLV
jgi:hypothetical protein